MAQWAEPRSMDLEQVVMNVDDTETGYFSILHTHTHC